MISRCWFAILTGFFCAAAHAQAPSIAVDDLSCIRTEDNAVLSATVSPEVGGAAVRLFFRWNQHGDFYFVDMEPLGGGRYWGVLPKPEKRNESVERYVSVVDPGDRELSRSKPATIPVNRDCKADLSPKQEGRAQNLTIGETVMPQKNEEVLGFLCDGIVTRRDARGILRPDDVCRTCVVAWWPKAAAAAAGIALIPLIIDTDDDPEPSPSRP
jgi:hypothetical protein